MTVIIFVLLFFASATKVSVSQDPYCMCGKAWCCDGGCQRSEADFSASYPNNTKPRIFENGEVKLPINNVDPGMTCFCWINQQRHQYQYTGGYTIQYLPPGSQWITPACWWCGNPASPLHVDLKGDFCWPISGRCAKDSDGNFVGQALDVPDPSQPPNPNDFNTCLELCKEWQAQSRLFIGTWQADYTPRTTWSEGFCLCEGFIDPCKYPG